MSIIKFTVPTVGGAMNPVKGDAGEIRVGKDQKSKVSFEGYLGAPREKGDDGKYHNSKTFGRLSLKAAIADAKDPKKQRYVLEIEGGLRGVLFPAKNKKDEKSPDYNGNIDLGDGTEMPLFGRKVHVESGDFISLSSGEAKAKETRGNAQHAAAAPADDDFAADSDIPF